MSHPQISDVCLVANLQTMGPTFLAASKNSIFDPGSGMLLAARIVITAGMGNFVTGMDRLNGPIPISELNLDEEYLVYYYPMEMQQQPRPDNQFSTGKGTYIICLVISDALKQDVRSFEPILERILKSYNEQFDFSKTISGEVPVALQKEFSMVLTGLLDDLNQILIFAAEFEGGSLFDIGLLANLPDSLSNTAKKLMLHPKGILESEIRDKSALKTLFQAGLVEKEERDGNMWIVPR